MKWPWAKDFPAPDPPDLDRSVAELDALVEQRPMVEVLRLRLRTHRTMNGFAELVFNPAGRK